MPNIKEDNGNVFHHVYSCDVSANLSIKIGSLEGHISKSSYEQIINEPLLRFAGRNYETRHNLPSIMLEAVVMVENQELHIPVRAPFKHFNTRWAWNTWLTFPLQFCDIPSDAVLCLNIYDCNGSNEKYPIGSTTITLFTREGLFRQGMLDLQVWEDREADGRVNGDTPGKIRDKEKEQSHRLAKLSKKYYSGKLPSVDWLDRLTFAEIERINQKDKTNSAKMFLNIEFPQIMDMDIPTNIVYFESNGETLVEPPEINDLVTFPDPEIGVENLVEKKHYKLARSHRTGLMERELKPNPETRNRLTAILGYPTTQPLTSEEQDLLWRFRYHLAANQKALAKFVKCVNWAADAEATQAMDLINKWAPMDVEDALELLGPNFTFQPLRKYAVLRLSQASDIDLQLYLLQLVQALKYENIPPSTPTTDSYSDPTEEEVPLLDSSEDSPTVAQIADQSPNNLLQESDENINLSSFLIRRAVHNSSLANYLYWYLLIECEDVEGVGMKKEESVQKMYRSVLKQFLLVLETSPVSELKERREFLKRQHSFLDRVVNLLRGVAKEPGSRVKKIDKLQALLQAAPDQPDSFTFKHFDSIPFPLDPSVKITGVIADKSSLFKSSLMPAKMTFMTESGSEYVAIFKLGDDLRQDQLILQIITLMDQLLRRENLDLRLSPYRVLATSSKHGMVEFVDAIAIAEVLRAEGTILDYFRKYNGHESGPYGVTSECMDNYVKSCAGYCVITYLLGVGDRHLDNLMLTRNGKLLHIDFGYILGSDPKPMPPPMKLSKEMIEGFGGDDSEYYQQFRRECYTAFLYLRRHANLILNLFGLMVDASVPDIALEPDKTVRKVQDKFRLDLNEEEAVQFISDIIDVSAKSLMPIMMERLHYLAQYMRK